MRPMPEDEIPPWRKDRYRALVDKSSGAEIDPRMKGIWPPRPPPPPRRIPPVLLIPALLVAMAFLLVTGLARLLGAIVADIASLHCYRRPPRRSSHR